jgi:hypothetical protein
MLFFTDRLLSQDLPTFDPIYWGVDAGWSFGIGESNSHGSGANFTGKSDARAQSGWTINAQVGCILSRWSRTEIQYLFLKNSYKWMTEFNGGIIENFTSRMHAHLALVNYYLGLGPLFKYACLDPYITGGVGLAFNSLFDIEERTPFGGEGPADVVFAKIKSHVHKNFCAQIGAGIRKSFGKRWLLNMKFNAYYLGTVKSGNTRDVLPPFIPIKNQKIGPYKFENMWMGSITLGMGYVF